MGRYLIRRLLWVVLVLFLVTLFTFVISTAVLNARPNGMRFCSAFHGTADGGASKTVRITTATYATIKPTRA